MSTKPETQSTALAEKLTELDSLSCALEIECAVWKRSTLVQNPKHPSPEYDALQSEMNRRSNVLWETATEAGRIFCALADLGVFDIEPRIKKALSHIRAEMERAQRDGAPPYYGHIVNVLYRPQDNSFSFDVFYVKMFETFCRVSAKSWEDRREFERYYVQLEEKGAFHAHMLRKLSNTIKERLA